MIRLASFLLSAVLLLACSHPAPPSSRVGPDARIKLIEHGTPPPAGTRVGIQFNNEPLIIHVADGWGGPPILYHGHELNPDRLKSIIILKLREARERFPNQNIDAVFLIELK